MIRTLLALALITTPAFPAGEAGDVTDYAFSFEGPFGSYDQQQLQRGLQVYTEVCAGCHGLRYVPIRALGNETGPALPPEQVRAYPEHADQFTNFLMIEDPATGEERERTEQDHFPMSSMENAPDLSLMAKARAGFHGPYGTGISQLVNGMGGPEYIASLLMGYTGEDKTEAGALLYENEVYPGGYIAMGPPLWGDDVVYADGTEATIEQQAQDVAAFLMWAAEPKLVERKRTMLTVVLFLGILATLLYFVNKTLWAPIYARKDDDES